MLCDQFAGMRMSVVGHVHQVASSSIDETTVVRTEYPESRRIAENYKLGAAVQWLLDKCTRARPLGDARKAPYGWEQCLDFGSLQGPLQVALET